MIDDLKKILSKFLINVPAMLLGHDRIGYFVEKFSQFSSDDRILMQKFMVKVLTLMIEREASDIEFGGHGSEGFTWMRIFGKKERVVDLPKFTLDESAILILSMLNENQRRYLMVTKSIDFSYTFVYERKMENVRFRATCYFDL
ncbi:MAG: twitching motility protein PilT, partial [Ignavibacteria bacterium]|nr:twitching motility protein PilT [Ignavibacteria bacterium]